MGSQNSKLHMDSLNQKQDNPMLHMNFGNGPHLSGNTILKPNYRTNTTLQNFSASTQDNASKRNSSYSYAESTSLPSKYFLNL